MKKLKKNWFCDFRPQKIIIFYRSRPNFWKTCQDNKKLPYHLLVGMFMDKVKNFCDHSMTLREMTDNLPTTVHFWTPPASFFLYSWIGEFVVSFFDVTNRLLFSDFERDLYFCFCFFLPFLQKIPYAWTWLAMTKMAKADIAWI